MSERNGRGIFPHSSFSNRLSVPFSTSSNTPFVSNSVPFHPMSFQNQYYPPQPLNMTLGIHYSGSDGNHSLPGPVLHNNYYTSIPKYEDGRNYRSSPTSLTNSNFSSNMHHSLTTTSDQYNYSYDNIAMKESPPKLAPSLTKPQELKVSAQAFVPRDKNEQGCLDDKFSHNNVLPSDPNLDSNNTNSYVNKSKYNNNNNNISTRPKEFNKGRGPVNRKNWSGTKPVQNWHNKENKVYSHQGFKSFNPDLPSPVTPEGAAAAAAAAFSNSDYNTGNQRTRPHYQTRSQNKGYSGYHEPGGYYNSRGRTNPPQKRQNYNPKRNEWRRSHEQNYDYNNYYYEDGRNVRQQSNNYNNKGPKKYNSYTNGSMKENDYEQAKQKEIEEPRQNRHYANDWSQHSKNKPNFSYLRSNNLTASAFQRRNNSSDGHHKEQQSNDSCEVREENDRDENVKELHLVASQDGGKQRENMVENLSKGMYECMVCCERIRQQHAIWSCNKCYNCFHLGCIKKWAGTSQGEPGWRCPACQNLNSKVPNGYFCFCKKLREPEWNRREIPHSCGEVCGRKRENEWCTHKCTILCHPGPCPDCTAFIKRQCQCGKNMKEMRCSQIEPYVCEEKCSHHLNCGIHFCEKLCHVEACEPCSVMIEEKCFCQKEMRSVQCTPETANRGSFSCNGFCNKTLSCGYHSCEQICHSGPCKPCSRAVETVTTCPCGKMPLEQYFTENKQQQRVSCLDPIPTCGKVCGKVLKCGTPGNFHTCRAKCHEGPCPHCSDQTAVKCRCGFMDKKIPCSELLLKADEVTCERQCKKLRQCGRHKCGLKCCIDIDHVCTRVCGRTLNCRQHKCQEPCHRGNCTRCWETSFEELSCHCGASVLYPPIPCGTEPPACELPCRRQQSCNHPVSHNCHADPKCPPCTTLVSKPCFGGHTTMKSTPCYVNAMSCGEQCAKKLLCGVHLCQKVCHDGPCIQGTSCTQKCSEIRHSCEHPCGNPCHSGKCPNTPCKEMVTVTCICGNRKMEMVCSENEREYKSMATSKLASELHSLNSGGSVDISQIFSGSNKSEKLKRLECNDECGLIARNRQLALALQITNPDARESLGDGGSNLYSDSLKEDAKKDLQFAQMVHTALNDLVLKAKQSKQKSRSHSFAPMNRDKRRFIHEYAKYFGCQSQSYDEEPKKNVVVTACKAMSRLPPMSVIAVIQKEQGQRRAPGPVLNRKALSSYSDENGTQMRRLEKNSSFEKKEKEKDSSVSTCTETPSKEQPIIDYFDFS